MNIHGYVITSPAQSAASRTLLDGLHHSGLQHINLGLIRLLAEGRSHRNLHSRTWWGQLAADGGDGEHVGRVVSRRDELGSEQVGVEQDIDRGGWDGAIELHGHPNDVAVRAALHPHRDEGVGGGIVDHNQHRLALQAQGQSAQDHNHAQGNLEENDVAP